MATALTSPSTALISYSGHSGTLKCDRLVYDSVTRSGNTITINNLRVEGNHYGTALTLPFGWTRAFWGWYGIWDNGSTTYGGTSPLIKTGTVCLQSGYGWWNDDPHIFHSGTMSFGNLSWTVSSSASGSRTFKFGLGFGTENSNANSNSSRDGSDPAPQFTVSYPANTKSLDVNLDKNGTSVGNTDGYLKFDIYVPNTTKVGSQVTDYYNASITTGTTWKVNNITEQSADWYYTGSSEYSGTLNDNKALALPVKPTSVPTGLDAALVSRAWNQIVAKATCSGFGAPDNRASRSISVGVAASSGTAWSNCYTTQSTTAATATGNKTFTHTNLKGCAAFKLGAYATNTKKSASVLESTVYYLPPAPMASVSLDSTTRNDTNVTFKVKATGKAADGTNNVSGAKVNLQYRYSTDGGTTYSAWTNAATNYTPNTAQTFNLNIAYNTAVKVQVRQATYQDTSQVTAALTLDIAAVHPIPKKPSLTFSWDELDRTLTTVSTNNGTGGASGDSSFKKFEYQMSWNSDFSSPFINTNPTSAPYTYTISYLKPLQTLYIRVRTVNNWDLASDWVSVSPTVPRPLWGLVKGTSEVTGNVETIEIRDMVKVKTDNTVSTRDWIEGTNNGKKRIVNT